MANNTIEILINEMFIIYLNKENEDLIKTRSTLLKALLENHDPESAEPIQIKLERPEKCSILFHYLETEEMSEELTNNITFASYINDVIHLGIQNLQNHMIALLRRILFENKGFMIDFSQSRPNIGFMENFFQNNREVSSYSSLDLILNWMGTKCEFTRDQVEGLLGNVWISMLRWDDLDQLQDRYPEAFDIVMPPPSDDDVVIITDLQEKQSEGRGSKRTRFG